MSNQFSGTYQEVLVDFSFWRVHGLDHELVLVFFCRYEFERLQTHWKGEIAKRCIISLLILESIYLFSIFSDSQQMENLNVY